MHGSGGFGLTAEHPATLKQLHGFLAKTLKESLFRFCKDQPAGQFWLTVSAFIFGPNVSWLSLGTRGFSRVRRSREKNAFRAGHYNKDLTETGNRARKVSGCDTQSTADCTCVSYSTIL